MTYENPTGRPVIVQDEKTPSRERALDGIIGLLRHPSVDVSESEALLVQFIRQTAFDAWEAGAERGFESHAPEDLTDVLRDNPYAEDYHTTVETSDWEEA